MYLNTQNNLYKYDSKGCQLDINDVPLNVPIYSTQRGRTDTIIGYNPCVTKTSSTVLYSISFIGASICAGIAGSMVFRTMFFMANPKLATGIYATGMASNALFGRR